MLQQGAIYRFGPYEYRPRTRELYKLGVKLKLRPQPMRVLELLLERTGDVVTREELRQALWPGVTFVDFEHGLNTSIKELRAMLSDSASEPRYIETLPKLGYRILVPVKVERAADLGKVAVPPETTVSSEAAAQPVAGQGTAATTPFAWRPAAIGIAIALIVAVSGVLIWRHLQTRPPTGNERLMIAVLPFENLTGDAAQDYFSDGLTEEMITQLGRLDPQHLGVIARTSVMQYKKTREQLDQIGRELGVQFVLEGSVRRDADRVRISAQLIEVKDQTQVWAREYDRELNGVLALQGEIARDIARETKLTVENGHKSTALNRQPLASPSSYEAYDLYLRGRYFWNKRTKDGFERAAEYFQQASAKDPQYARAYAGLADTYGLMSTWRLAPQNEFMPKARTAALKALEIDDTVAEAHTSLALVLENYDYDWQRAEKEFRRAIELDPEYATAHQWYAEYLSWHGRFDEALAESERARQLDPLSLIIATDHGAILYFARQYDRAIAQFRAVLDMDPSFDRARVLLAFVYAEKGEFREARDEVEHRADPDDPQITWASKAYVYGRWGRKPEAELATRKLEELVRESQADPGPPLLFAYLGLNQKDQAIALLQKASREHSNAVVGAKVAPYDDPLRSDPRFQEVLQRIGLAQ
jgi:TolB-like protein/DNA-binding winged helix-turn-helix (wHTH) protein/Tfp pilus assembly protein PilF